MASVNKNPLLYGNYVFLLSCLCRNATELGGTGGGHSVKNSCIVIKNSVKRLGFGLIVCTLDDFVSK